MSLDFNKNQHILIATSFVIFMTSLDAGIFNVILPTIAHSFSININIAQYSISSYLFVVLILVVPMGYIGSILGKEIVYISGIFVFLFGCLFAYTAYSFYALILARLLQGTGAAMILSSNQAILVSSCKNSIDKRYFLSINTAAVTLGTLLGPVLGGFLIGIVPCWQWIFLLFLLPGLFGLFFSFIYMSFSKKILFQLVCVLGSIAILIITNAFALLFNLEKYIVYGYCAAVVTLGVSVFSKNRKRFFEKNIANSKKQNIFLMLFSYVVLFANNLSVSCYLSFRHLSSVNIGLMLSIAPVMVMLSSLFAKKVIAKFSEHQVIKCGTLLLIIACLLVACFNEIIMCLVISQCMIGVAMGALTPSISSLLYASISVEYYSLVSSIASLARNIGKIVGVIYPAMLLSFNFSPFYFMFNCYVLLAISLFVLVRKLKR